jgi:hypothetical protein
VRLGAADPCRVRSEGPAWPPRPARLPPLARMGAGRASPRGVHLHSRSTHIGRRCNLGEQLSGEWDSRYPRLCRTECRRLCGAESNSPCPETDERRRTMKPTRGGAGVAEQGCATWARQDRSGRAVECVWLLRCRIISYHTGPVAPLACARGTAPARLSTLQVWCVPAQGLRQPLVASWPRTPHRRGEHPPPRLPSRTRRR